MRTRQPTPAVPLAHRTSLLLAAALVLCACSSPAVRTPARAQPLAMVDAADATWLTRAGFGLDGAALTEYRRLGRAGYLESQLHPQDTSLPEAIERQLAAAAGPGDAASILSDLRLRRQAIEALADPQAREAARKSLNDDGNRAEYAAVRVQLLRAVYSPAQLKEQMTWFWLNHFSLYQYKADVRWLAGDYEDHAIRPYALGNFRDLVLATLEHPAMLQYLDNAQNAAGHVNENYARELMELHTLGVQGGYTQKDVEALAHILTGAGINPGAPPKLRPQWQRLYVRRGAFEFDPARHDFSAQVLLGTRIEGGGMASIERAVDLITAQPACARFISRKLATYFLGDSAPAALVDAMAATFRRSGGDIAATLHTLLSSPQFAATRADRIRDPMHYVLASVRLAYDGRTLTNVRPVYDWLNALGEAPFNRSTPDGYPLSGRLWESPGQMSRRFEIARAIGSGDARLFAAEDGQRAPGAGFPQLSNRLYYQAIEPYLAPATRNALARAASPQEWNTFLLASPEMNYE